MSVSKLQIGWIGAGKMGLPICKRLKDAGHKLAVLGRSDASRAQLFAAGLDARSSIKDVVAGADVVFAAITDDASLGNIVGGDGGVAANLAAGKTFVEMSTVSPAASAAAAALLAARGIAYLRAPVSGSTSMAEAGTLTALVSGPQQKYDDLGPVFSAFTRKVFHVGDGEEARVLKLVLNAMVGATSALVAEALAFGRKGGLDNATMLDVITQSAVASPLIGYKRDMIVSGDYTPAFPISGMMKDFDILLSVGRSAHCPLPLAAQIRQFYEAAYVRGQGDRDFFALVEEFAQLAGVGGKSSPSS